MRRLPRVQLLRTGVLMVAVILVLRVLMLAMEMRLVMLAVGTRLARLLAL